MAASCQRDVCVLREPTLAAKKSSTTKGTSAPPMYMMSVDVEAKVWMAAVRPRKTSRAQVSKRTGLFHVARLGNGT